MPRTVTDADGVDWTLAEAYAGLSEGRAEGVPVPETVEVVATPSGGAQTRRLTLPGTWSDLADDDLAARLSDAA